MGGIKDTPSFSWGRALYADPLLSGPEEHISGVLADWVMGKTKDEMCVFMLLEFVQVRFGRKNSENTPQPWNFARTEPFLYHGSKSVVSILSLSRDCLNLSDKIWT